MIDIGAGGGFPIMPLKALREDINAYAVESLHKKCAFMRSASTKAGIGVQIRCGRAEELAHLDELRESFDVCVSRAVASLRQLLEITVPFVKGGGCMLAYKTDYKTELAEARGAVEALHIEVEQVFDAGIGKNVVMFKKTA